MSWLAQHGELQLLNNFSLGPSTHTVNIIESEKSITEGHTQMFQLQKSEEPLEGKTC